MSVGDSTHTRVNGEPFGGRDARLSGPELRVERAALQPVFPRR